MIDIQAYYQKLAANDPISEDEIVSLLKELAAMREGVAHLAGCQAATLEGLPKSTSKSQWQRHHNICLTAAEILQGNVASIRYKTTIECAVARCLKATLTPFPAR